MKVLRVVLAVALVAAGQRAQAAAVTTTFPVTATVVPTCKISAAALAFPNYDTVTGAAVDGQSSLTVTCTLSAAYTIALDNGVNGAVATVASRAMVAGGQHLDYGLFSDAGRIAPWGGATTVPGSGSGVAQTVLVYGRIVAGQNVAAGTYADSVTVTVNF